jgi:hypothetical protein
MRILATHAMPSETMTVQMLLANRFELLSYSQQPAEQPVTLSILQSAPAAASSIALTIPTAVAAAVIPKTM